MSRQVLAISVPLTLARAVDDAVAARQKATLSGNVNRSTLIREALSEYLERHQTRATRCTKILMETSNG